MDIYFDNAATTKPIPAIWDAVSKYKELYANPSSAHTLGLLAEHELKAAGDTICRILGCGTDELFFTSGGTESNNMALFGAARAKARTGNHIITAQVEHPSVHSAIKELEAQGFDIEYTPVDARGLVDTEQLLQLVTPKTILVALMQVNNETGAMQNIAAIADALYKINPAIHFHVDGVQSFCKHSVFLGNISSYSMSAHKINGLKGTGALYVKRSARIVPLFFGGGQGRGLRPGTENTFGIMAFGIAAEKFSNNTTQYLEKVTRLRDRFIANIQSIPEVVVNSTPEVCSAYITNVSFLGVKPEVLLHALADEGIYCSAGAACHGKNAESILAHYGLSADRVDSALRFSFSAENTEAEVDTCCDALSRHVPFLRKFWRH